MLIIATILITHLLTLLTLLIGYNVGVKSHSTDPLKVKIPRIFPKKKTKLGAITKMSQTDIEKKGTRLEETEKAMEETLDKII